VWGQLSKLSIVKHDSADATSAEEATSEGLVRHAMSMQETVSCSIYSHFLSEVPDVRFNHICYDKLLYSYPVHITLNTADFLHLVYLPFWYISYAYFWLCLLIC
jgi:hypothetical protein